MGIKDRKTKLLASIFLMRKEDEKIELTDDIQYIFNISLNSKTKSTISKLVDERLIIKEVIETKLYLSLTDLGLEHLSLEFPFSRFLNSQWDGKWRILSYEIPEKQREMRDRLRREVSGWGLGPWHRSFWVTPHPIIPYLNRLVSNTEEEKYIQAFESDHVFGNRSILIEKVWGLAEIQKEYQRLFKTWHDYLASNIDNKQKLYKIVDGYITILRKDPGLPKELVGENWIGFESFKIFKEISQLLLKK